MEGGEGGGEVGADGHLDLCKEVWEPRTQPIHHLLPVRQQLDSGVEGYEQIFKELKFRSSAT